MSQTPNTQQVAIAVPHPAAVAAAREIAEAGGNAVDAAVAAAAVLTVVYPHNCSVGGDLIALVRRPNGQQICINASGAYGSSPEIEKLAGLSSMPILGPLTVSVPGVASGWATLLEEAGSLPVADILAPAIRLAEEGMIVSPGLAESIELENEGLYQDPGMRSMFFRNGQPLREGDRVLQPALAETLTQLAEEGLDSLYRGKVAQRLAHGFEALGVPVTAQDLALHQPSIEEPLTRSFGPVTVSTAAPNSQGYTLLRNLGALFTSDDNPSKVDAGVLAELFYSSDALRDNQLADPRFVDQDVSSELTVDALARAAKAARQSLITGQRAEFAHTPRPGGDTVGIATVSEDGTAVSLIQSVFHSFGSQILEPETGLVLHNRAAFFSLEVTSPNRLQPGKRPAHTLVPVIVEHQDGTISAHGTMGGKAQSQIHTQLILRSLEGLEPEQIVTAPRFIVGGLEAGSSNDRIMAEPGLEPARAEQLRQTTMIVTKGKELDSDAGHSMVARRNPDGTLAAGADPRSDGAAWAGR